MADQNKVVQLVIAAKDQASAVIGGVSDRFGKLTAAAAAAAAAISGYFSARLFTGAVESGASLEQALASIRAATGASADEMSKLKAAAENAGRSTVFSSTEAANALETLGKAGLNAQQSIQTLPSLLALAQGQGMSLDQTASILTNTINQMGLSFDQAARVSDVLAKGANISNASVEGLALSLSYVGPLAKSAGLSLEQTVAVLDQLASAGLVGERAGTGLSQMLVQLSNPASQARQELAKLGDTSSSLGDAIDAIKRAGPNATAAINAFGQSAIPTVQALASGGTAAVQTFATQLNNAGGSAQTAADEMNQALNPAFKLFQNSLDGLQKYIAEPLLKPLADTFRDLSKAVNDAVTDGSLNTFRQTVVDVFTRGKQAVLEFVKSFDFKTAAQSASDSLNGLNAKFEQIQGVGSTVATVLTGTWNGFRAGVDGIGAVLASVAAAFLAFAETAVAGLNKVGLVSDDTLKSLQKMQGGAEAIAQAYGKDMVESATRAHDAFANLGKGADDAAAKINAAGNTAKNTASAIDDANAVIAKQSEGMKSLGLVWDQASKSFVQAAAATQSATEQTSAAIDRQIDAVKRQGDAGVLTKTQTEAFIATLNNQKAALNSVTESTASLGKAADDSTQQLDGLYKSLGIVNKADEESKLDQEKSQLDALRESGKITAEEYYKLADAIAAKKAALADDNATNTQAVQNNQATADSANKAAEAQKAQAAAQAAAAQAALDAAPAVSAYQEAINNQIIGIQNYNKTLAENINLVVQQGQSWYGVATAIKDLSAVTDSSPLGTLNTQLKEASAASDQAAKDMQKLGTAAQAATYGGFASVLSAIAEQKKAVADAAAENLKYQISLEKISESAANGSISLFEQYQQLTALKSQYRNLDQASLSKLQGQIDQVTQSLQSMSDQADQTLANLQSQLAQAQGRLVDQASIEAQQKILDLQTKINEAKAAGNQKALDDLNQALRVQQQLNDIALKQAKSQELQTKTQDQQASNTSASTQPIKTVRIDLGQGAGFDVPANQEGQVMAFINQLKASRAVSSK